MSQLGVRLSARLQQRRRIQVQVVLVAAALLAIAAAAAADYMARELSDAELDAFKQRRGVVVFPQKLDLIGARYFIVKGGTSPEGGCRIGALTRLVPDRAGHLPAEEQVGTDLAHCEAVFRRGFQP